MTVIDISCPGQWETLSSYCQSVKHWEGLKHNPLFDKAATKERKRYEYLKREVFSQQ